MEEGVNSWGPHTPSHPWELGQCQRRASLPFQGGFLPLLLRVVVRCRCHLFLWGDREETLMGQENSGTFIQAMLSRILDRHTGWCSPRMGGEWNCPLWGKEMAPTVTRTFLWGKTRLGSWSPPQWNGSRVDAASPPLSPACLVCFSGKSGVHLLAQEDKEELLPDQCSSPHRPNNKNRCSQIPFSHYLSISLYGNTSQNTAVILVVCSPEWMRTKQFGISHFLALKRQDVSYICGGLPPQTS